MKKRDYLRPDELERLLTAAKQTRNPERDYALVLMAFRHGLRASELCALRLDDVNLEGAKSIYAGAREAFRVRIRFSTAKRQPSRAGWPCAQRWTSQKKSTVYSFPSSAGR
jgi:type 1 fimbriae regulatory protein FimB/type 1 fimbriae regulatory protein FimE